MYVHMSITNTGCLQLLEILEILEISWIFVDAPGKIYNQQCNFCHMLIRKHFRIHTCMCIDIVQLAISLYV